MQMHTAASTSKRGITHFDSCSPAHSAFARSLYRGNRRSMLRNMRVTSAETGSTPYIRVASALRIAACRSNSATASCACSMTTRHAMQHRSCAIRTVTRSSAGDNERPEELGFDDADDGRREAPCDPGDAGGDLASSMIRSHTFATTTPNPTRNVDAKWVRKWSTLWVHEAM